MTAKILVVDDEPLLKYVIEQFFRKAISTRELEFQFVGNGAEAIEKLEASSSFDMVLTDIRMPEMDGLTLLERLPTLDPTLKVVVVSAYGDIQNIRTAMNRGAFDFLTKPIDFQDLKITINKTLEFVQRIRSQEHQLAVATQQLHYQAFYDPLTGLPNRYGFLEEAGEEFKARLTVADRLVAVLFLALSHYQIVKYSLGHAFAEQLLVEVARRWVESVGSAGFAARVGEDAFAVWLTDIAHSQDATEIASRLHRVLEQPFNLNGTVVFSGVFTGIALGIPGEKEPEDLLRAADAAMHDAQVRGLTTPAVFEPSMEQQAVARLQLEADLQQAIALQQFYLHYQPIISIVTGQLMGFEALVRWQHPERGVVSPAEFIPVAEKAGLIVPLGEWVLEEAIRHLSGWRSQFPACEALSASVNLSGMQLFDPNLVPHLQELLRSHSLSGEFLKLEITESVLMENAAEVAGVLQQLKELRIQVCLDDFGTGYSNLLYLQCLPIDTLKIDRSFVSGMEDEGKNFALVKAIVNLASSLDLDTIAEGVETQQQLELLRSLGCNYCQGYFFSRPLATEAAIALLAHC